MNEGEFSDQGWQPNADLETAKTRAIMLSEARRYFEDRNVLEIETSTLSKYAVTDPHIESVRANSNQFAELFLHTSPELKMKRLLAADFGDIYQICKVFRDDEYGRNHLPEFTLIEWYRNQFSLKQIMRETVSFISCLLESLSLPTAAEYMSYQESFLRSTKIDPLHTDSATLVELLGADEELRKSIGDDCDTWLDLTFTDRVVSEFATDRLTVLFHYPASQAALARHCPVVDGVADRFEVFFGQLELANGFVELTDADEQAERFLKDLEIRASRGMPSHNADEQFIAALRAGLPQCAGVAVGFDRLLMVRVGAQDIRDVTNFIL